MDMNELESRERARRRVAEGRRGGRGEGGKGSTSAPGVGVEGKRGLRSRERGVGLAWRLGLGMVPFDI